MNQEICVVDLDFIVGFAFIDLIKSYGRRAISEYRIEKYLNQTISALNNYFESVQFMPGYLDKTKVKNNFFRYDSNTGRFALFKNADYESLKKYYYDRAEKYSKDYKLNYNLLISIMESNINTFVLYY